MHKDDCIWTEPNRCNCGWLQDIAKNPCEAVREIARLRAELELHKGALIAEQEHVETLEAELSASREDAERYRHLLREAYVFGRTTPDVHNLPNEPVSLWLHSTVPLDVEGINRIVDAGRKGEEE